MDSVQSYLDDRSKEFDLISDERKNKLKEISIYISKKLGSENDVQLTFICTHNSRRSHLAQLFAQAGSDFYNLDGIKTFSGGTESTAFNPRAVAAIKRAGFKVINPGGDNPHYEVLWDKNKPYICYSKKYSDPENPSKNFAAIMVCSDADEACPIVFGAEERFSLPYIDPKDSDNTPEESETYDNKAKEIAREMLYMLSLIK
jgi:hypothetical protein